jgi:hypothetical protein
MKNRINFLVTDEQIQELKDQKKHVFKTRLTKKAIENLPRAIEANPFMLVFPSLLCPKTVAFRTKKKESCQREIINIFAVKDGENGEETLIVRMK